MAVDVIETATAIRKSGSSSGIKTVGLAVQMIQLGRAEFCMAGG
jgi:3-oxoacyl-(acyl-carrier-protein) synthase